MEIKRYVTNSADMTTLAQAEEVHAVRVILEAARIKRDELRDKVETRPKFSPDKLEDDLVFLEGFIKGLNWTLGLSQKSRDYINTIK